jgi:hypothetical protein
MPCLSSEGGGWPEAWAVPTTPSLSSTIRLKTRYTCCTLLLKLVCMLQ